MATTLWIPRKSERQSLTVSGAPGAGKSQIMIQLLDQIRRRLEETVILSDPKGSLFRRYFDPSIDTLLNPFDMRCPSWSPYWEIEGLGETQARAVTLAQGRSAYPIRPGATEQESFFPISSADLWSHLVTYHQPESGREMGFWMNNARPELDRRVSGSRLEQDLDPGATPQRNAIISTFTRIEQALSSIPDVTEAPRWTVRDFCRKRRGWIFLTNTPNTKDALKPIQSIWMDSLIREILEMGSQPTLPDVWFAFDELADLQQLPMLERGLNQGREFGLRFMLGYQARSQVKMIYGEDQADSILSAPKLNFYLRTSESSAAEWMSKQIGDQRIEELHENFNAHWIGGNKQNTVSTQIKERRAVIASQLMGLPDLTGYVRHENSVVGFKLQYTDPKVKGREEPDLFIPRESEIPEKQIPISVAAVEDKFTRAEAKAAVPDPIVPLNLTSFGTAGVLLSVGTIAGTQMMPQPAQPPSDKKPAGKVGIRPQGR